MTENKRFIVDDVGTLIDMETRETYDYVSDVCSILNGLNDENEQLKQENRKAVVGVLIVFWICIIGLIVKGV